MGQSRGSWLLKVLRESLLSKQVRIYFTFLILIYIIMLKELTIFTLKYIFIILLVAFISWLSSTHASNEVQPNMQSIELAVHDSELLTRIVECENVDTYLYYKEGFWLALAIDQECEFDSGVYYKTILLDVISDTYKWERVFTSELINNR